MIKEQITRRPGRISRRFIADTQTPLKNGRLRNEIQGIRGDLYDIVADSLKWNSVLTTLVDRIWAAMPEEQKAGLPAEDRVLIEAFLQEFRGTETRMDKQIAAEGSEVVSKLLERERRVAELFVTSP